MASTTEVGKTVQNYTNKILQRSLGAGKQAVQAGYPATNQMTKDYYSGVKQLAQYGDKEAQQALERAVKTYKDYKQAGQYDQTDFGDIADLYKQAGLYDQVYYGDIEDQYGQAGEYAPTDFSGAGEMYLAGAQYDPSQFLKADYTTQNIQERMSPYEELVAAQESKRLKKAYDEARGEREQQAVRAGAFGGSGAAIQEEVARRNYLEQMDQMNARNLQSAFESGAGLYSKEVQDRLAAQQAEEQSRQYGAGLGMEGIQGYLSSLQAQEAAAQFGKGAEFQGLAGKMAARGATAEQIAAAKAAEFQGLQGLMGTRQQTAAQVAAAKEAELAALQGRTTNISQQAAIANQQKQMQLANLGALQAAGTQKQQNQLAAQMYPLSVRQAQANISAALQGNVAPLPSQEPSKPGFLDYLGAAGSAALGIGSLFKRDGGLIRRYNGGGLADFEPQYYDAYER